MVASLAITAGIASRKMWNVCPQMTQMSADSPAKHFI
jgi:hypothetical protein